MTPMLAGKYIPEKVARHLPVYAQPKYDGIRVFIRDGVAYTRSLKAVRSVQVQSRIAHNKEIYEGLDGEFICGDPTAKDCYQRTMSSVMSMDKPDNDLKFYVFDRCDNSETFEERLASLYQEAIHWTEDMILSETILFQTISEIEDHCASLISLGHEGIVIRNPQSYYKYGRGSPTHCELIKMKDGRWFDTEAIIVDKHEKMSNQNEAMINALGHTERSGHLENMIPTDTLGSLSVRGVFPDDEKIPAHVRGQVYETRIGSGFDEAQREELWYQDDLVGKIVKFKFFTSGIKDKPRFPIFLGFRDADDMSIESIQGELF